MSTAPLTPEVEIAPTTSSAPPPISVAQLQGKVPMGVPARITHDGEEDLRFAAIPLQMYESPRNTLAQRKGAIAGTYSGRLMEAVDLYRSTILQDGFFDGILRTMAEGILQLPLSFTQGTPAMRSALLNADGTAGDWAAMHPLEECAQIFKDGLVGFPGLGQYLLMCWQCGWTDSERVQEELAEGSYQGGAGTFEVCKNPSCRAKRIDKPVGQRSLFRLEWRDCRWLDQIPTTFQWYYTGRSGRVPIGPGDGEWLMFMTTPKLEAWRHGIWIWATLYALFSRDAQYDAQNTSQVTAPTPVLRAVKPVAESTRAAAAQRISLLGFDNRMVLNGEWIYEIVAANAEYKDICTDIVVRTSDAFETGLTGNVMGRAARTAFTDAGIYKRTTAERRGAAAQLWMQQTRDQGLVHWGRDNWGTRNVPVGALDARSPEDKLKDAQALGELGTGVKTLVLGLKEGGLRPTQDQLVELCLSAGVRVEPIPRVGTQFFRLDPKDEIAGIMIGEWRADQGLPPLGDGRDRMMMASISPTGAPTAPQTSPAPPVHPPAPEARRELPEDDGEDARRASLAAGLAGCRSCEHGRTHTCERCGVTRTYGAPTPGPDGTPTFPVAWRALRSTLRARENQERDEGGRFAGGATHISSVGGTFEKGPHGKAHWAATKAAETGKTVYVTPSAEAHSEGYKLATKIGASDSKKGYSTVHPDGSIVHHNGGAIHGGGSGRLAARVATDATDELAIALARLDEALETLAEADGAT